MKLTKQHIDRLYQFTQQHYVEHFDVQTELVDHLANGIERRCDENPNLSFEDALKLEFKQFGVLGFSDVVAEKTKAINKRYNKLIWKFFKAYFSWPKVTIFLLIVISVYGILISIPAVYRIDVIVIQFMFLVFLSFVFIVKNMRSRKSSVSGNTIGKTPIFLLEDIIIKTGNIGFIGITLAQLPQFIFGYDQPITNQTVLLAVATITAAYILLVYVVYIVLPSKAKDFLVNEYEEYRLLNG